MRQKRSRRDPAPRSARVGRAAACAAAVLLGLSIPAVAEEAAEGDRTRRWAEEKCARYRSAWEQSLELFGTAGLRAAFLERHAAFVASGCRREADVCPKNEVELALANAMIVFAMNAGAASTFPPFACRD